MAPSLRNILTLYRLGPYYVSCSRDFGKRDILILESDEALVANRGRLK